jgi:hypothetical protein
LTAKEVGASLVVHNTNNTDNNIPNMVRVHNSSNNNCCIRLPLKLESESRGNFLLFLLSFSPNNFFGK